VASHRVVLYEALVEAKLTRVIGAANTSVPGAGWADAGVSEPIRRDELPAGAAV